MDTSYPTGISRQRSMPRVLRMGYGYTLGPGEALALPAGDTLGLERARGAPVTYPRLLSRSNFLQHVRGQIRVCGITFAYCPMPNEASFAHHKEEADTHEEG